MKTILFDVDGTLLDTTYLHTVSWWQAFRQAGHDVPMALIHRGIGLGSDELFDHLLGSERDRDGDDSLVGAHLGLYGQYWERLPQLPGAVDLIREVKGRGHGTVLASSASAEELAALRRALDADEFIDAATSSDDADAGKPSPDILHAALDAVGAQADDAVLVGDAVWDAIAAAKAGVTFVGVLCGGTSEAELRAAGAHAVFRDPAELLARIDSTPLA